MYFPCIIKCRGFIFLCSSSQLLYSIPNQLSSLYKNHVTLTEFTFDPLNAELNPICFLQALVGAHHIFHVSRLGVNIVISSYGQYSKVVYHLVMFPDWNFVYNSYACRTSFLSCSPFVLHPIAMQMIKSAMQFARAPQYILPLSSKTVLRTLSSNPVFAPLMLCNKFHVRKNQTKL